MKPTLQGLELSNSPEVNNEVVSSIVAAGQHIRQLGISQCPHIGDAAVRAVTEHCADLQWLDVSGNMGLTPAAIKTIDESCQHLKYLKIHNSIGLLPSLSQFVHAQEESENELDENSRENVQDKAKVIYYIGGHNYCTSIVLSCLRSFDLCSSQQHVSLIATIMLGMETHRVLTVKGLHRRHR